MKKLKKAEVTIVQVPKYVTYECPYCGEKCEVDFDDFYNDRTSDYWPEREGDTVICHECGKDFKIGNVEVD